MATPDNRIPANRVGLVVAVLLAAWLTYSFYPKNEKPAPAVAPVTVESDLNIVGLEDNPDWEAMPGVFAIWADQAEWRDGKTIFAYWHPGIKSYSYYFEAVRNPKGFRFRTIPEPPETEAGFHWDESLGEDCPIRFYKSVRKILPVQELSRSVLKDSVATDGKPRVPVKIPEVKLPPPKEKP